MKKKEKEKSFLYSQCKKIQLLKNIYINLKCIKTKDDNKINKSSHKYRYKKTFEEIKKRKINEKNITKNKNDKQKSKTKKKFYSNSNNNSIKKCNTFLKNRIIKKTYNIINNESILNNMSKSENNIRYSMTKKEKNNNSKKISTTENKIYQNNPLELTFGSSNFMSNNQTESKEIGKNKNKSFLVSINKNKDKREKKDFVRHNIIIKLKKKLYLNPNWKIKKKDNNRGNKSEIIIKNYKTKNKYEFINNHYTNININYKEKNYHSVNISNEIRKSNKKINIRSEKDKMKKNELIKNKLIKNRNEKEKFKNKKCRNYTAKNSDILQKSTLKKIKSSNNNKEYIIRININNKENGRYKLIIKRINQYKKRMPRSAPKLFLAHPSLKNLFL